ncbi:MAG TPA: sulfotransferase [Acetobacteraceae bacterium]|jgi:hypothetical protein|nr:sulfotransferase [Acetobacteraceae bacterium]
MSLKVIGVGFGRTGTLSLKLALEQLGFGPCYHMVSVIHTPGAAEHWAAAAAGRAVDWPTVFDGYQSTTDWPACDYWRELIAQWPAAKVILTLRDPDSWFRSTQETIFSNINGMMAQESALGRTMRAIITGNFGGDAHDRATCIAAFERHNAEIRRSIRPDQLLVFEVAEGWAPLCGFLGVPVPTEPFPRTNSTDEFRARASAAAASAGS